MKNLVGFITILVVITFLAISPMRGLAFVSAADRTSGDYLGPAETPTPEQLFVNPSETPILLAEQTATENASTPVMGLSAPSAELAGAAPIENLQSGTLPAFPGAEGYGIATTGGRGGRVIYVTTLAPDPTGIIPGYLNWALRQSGPRYILFKVSGVIHSTAEIVNGNVTLAGQTSPGGIIVRGLVCDGHYDRNECDNLIIRHMRSRLDLSTAIPPGVELDEDTLRMDGVRNFIIDHSSFANSSDEVVQISWASYGTLQNVIMAETVGAHNEYGGMLMNYSHSSHPQDYISIHHNMWHRIFGRLPEITCATSGVEYNGIPEYSNCQNHSFHLELSNNLIWDPGFTIWTTRYVNDDPAYGQYKLAMNMVNNYMVTRPSFPYGMMYHDFLANNQNSLYFSGNRINRFPAYSDYQLAYCCNDFPSSGPNTDLGTAQRLSSRLDYPSITYTTTDQVVNYMINNAGAFPRDAMDRRYILSLQTNTIDTTPLSQAGARDAFTLDFNPSSPPTPEVDTDSDGMPDWFETRYGLNPNVQDHNGSELSVLFSGVSGYTNLECYLNWLSDHLVSDRALPDGGDIPTPTATSIPTETAVPTPTNTPTPTATPNPTSCSIYPSNNIWNVPVNSLPVDPNSNAYVTTIGASRTMHADFGSGTWNGGPIGFPVDFVSGTQPLASINYTAYGDESDAGPFPIPTDARVEGGSNSDGDRHVLVVNQDSCILYELYNAFPQSDGSWDADSGAKYDLKTNAPLRTSGWTSADAAGLPIAPGLVTYDEVASGEIKHAIRFTVPQTRRAYVWPARHFASDLTGAQYPSMGQRFRLKANFPISNFAPEVQVILRALKKYGMIVADNGSSWYISGSPDERWNNDNLHQLDNYVPGSAFEAVYSNALMIGQSSGQARSLSEFALPAVYDERNTRILYSGKWVNVSSSLYYSRTLKYSTAINSAAVIYFKGNRISLVYAGAPTYGTATIQIDNRPAIRINQYASRNQYPMRWTSGVLGNAYHVLRIAHASGRYITLDSIAVLSP